MAPASTELEKHIEARFVRACTKRGWLCLKQNVTGRRGYPDRLVIREDGTHVWIELKRQGGVLSPMQVVSIDGLKARNCAVHVCYSAEEAVAAVEMA